MKTRILHLTDIHLPQMLETNGEYGATDIVKDKEVFGNEETRTMFDRVKQSLREYVAREEGRREISAVVVSGDFTSFGRSESINPNDKANEKLLELLEIIAPTLVKDCPLIIVPGNHDVVRGKRLDKEYYAFDSTDHRMRLVLPYTANDFEPENSYFIDNERATLYIAINSSEYCGASRKREEVMEAINNLSADPLIGTSDEITAIRNYLQDTVHEDAIRISPPQIDFLLNVMRKAEEAWRATGDERKLLKVAVLHHHILPVTKQEEIKPYESIVNLSHVRHFLRAFEFDIALHGHKHRFFYYYDAIPDLAHPDAPYHRLLTISGPPLLSESTDAPAFLEVTASNLRPPAVEILPFALAYGAFPISPLQKITKRLYDRWEGIARTDGLPLVIDGTNVSDVHSRVIDQLEGRRGEAPNVVCHVECINGNPKDFEAQLSKLFAEQKLVLSRGSNQTVPPGDAQEDARRFEEIVDWWQLNNSGPSVDFRFTHGSRVSNYGQAVDQLREAINRLAGGSMTTKAIISLLEPPRDLIGRGNFPSFCLLQFVVREDEHGRLLDCIAYFRKQEMRQWWLVNMAEIVRMRNEVLESVSTGEAGLRGGSITTIAGRAKVASSPPQVSVPAIDRDAASDEGRARIAQMVYSLASTDAHRKAAGGNAWRIYLEDLRPPKIYDADGIPIAVPGLHLLAALLEPMRHDHLEEWSELMELVSDLESVNRAFVTASGTKGSNAYTLFKRWRRDAERRITKIEELVNRLESVNSQ